MKTPVISVAAVRGCLLAAAVLLSAGTAAAEATWRSEVLIPEVLSIRAPEDAIRFDFSDDYPPLEFPVRYPGGTMPLQLQSSLEGSWSVSLEISNMSDDSGTRIIPANQVYYRINGGPWLQANAFPEIIHTASGPTFGWLELRIEFAVELTGNEQAGEYQLEMIFTAQSETL